MQDLRKARKVFCKNRNIYRAAEKVEMPRAILTGKRRKKELDKVEL